MRLGLERLVDMVPGRFATAGATRSRKRSAYASGVSSPESAFEAVYSGSRFEQTK